MSERVSDEEIEPLSDVELERFSKHAGIPAHARFFINNVVISMARELQERRRKDTLRNALLALTAEQAVQLIEKCNAMLTPDAQWSGTAIEAQVSGFNTQSAHTMNEPYSAINERSPLEPKT